jgi:Zn-dependent protease with chaperone function
MVSGTGIYFDGKTSARHDVVVDAAPDMLRIHSLDGTTLAQWPYARIEAMSSPDDVLRIGLHGDPVLARLETRDAALAAAIDEFADTLDRSGMSERRVRRKVILWTLAATASLLAVAVVGLPLLADRLAPLIPLSVEHRLGVAVDKQIRAMLEPPGNADKPFECGIGVGEQAGAAALDKLVRALEGSAGLPIPLRVSVVRRSEANAIALPGGHVYVFQGLVEKSDSPDELAGVMAHEIGHVAHRDGTRSILQSAGLSFLFGMLLGDFTGGGVVVIAARTLAQSAYSREVEAAADRYGVQLMTKIGGNPRALGTILTRIGSSEPGIKILLDHPETKKRVAAIEAATPNVTPRPLLEPREWSALRQICG